MSNYGNPHHHRTCRRHNQRGDVQPARRPHQFTPMACPVGNESCLWQRSAEVTRSTGGGVGRVGRNAGGRRNHQRVDRWYPHIAGRVGTVCESGYRFPYTAVQAFHQEITAAWPQLRGVLALEGVNWRQWSAADFASVGYRLLRRAASTPDQLRELFELVGDRDALAALDREIMGQGSMIEVQTGKGG